MKNKFIKLSKPCTENWENMKSLPKGNFCELCSKTVIDFTQLNQFEIADKMKKSNGSICARITQSQLNEPLPDFETLKKYNLPYSNIAAGVLIAATLSTGQPLQSQTLQVKTEMALTTDTVLETKQSKNESLPPKSNPDDFTVFKGIVKTEKDGKPVKDAKITLVTVDRFISVQTGEDGTFSMKIPTFLIDRDNVVRVSYPDYQDEKALNSYTYEMTDYILTKADVNSFYKITAIPMKYYLGGISSYSQEERVPIVLNNGKEVNYKEFSKARFGAKSSCSLENKDYSFFESKIAIAIYSNKAKYGLYILTYKAAKD